ncbi:TonB-dependent receptor [Sphingomonas sp. MMS12-HWE2-04]|uniref:TonB-dependent receptor n=1 Tax=Sphingomonas sp. MMS12-HWE2-04 TaxID=3234199 RepID=UPI003850DC68
MVKWGCAIAGLMVGAMPMAASAQDQSAAAPAAAAAAQEVPAHDEAAAEPTEAEGPDIVVSGKLEGAVPGDIKPEVQLSPSDIRAFGASNVGELLTQLSAQLGSGQGRGGEQPVILISGRRASMAEVRDLPPEALDRIDILPEEVALKYGYSATQKVVNFVLRKRFMALTTEVEGRTPTDGGNAGVKAEAKLDKIRRDDRLSLNVNYNQSSGILESERGVSRAGASRFDALGNIVGVDGGVIDQSLGQSVSVVGVPQAAASGPLGLAAFAANANQANATDVRPYRTLVSPQKDLQISGVYRRPLSSKVTAVATVELEGTETQSLQGLPGVTLDLPAGNPYSPFSQDVQLLRYASQSPLTRSSSTRSAELGLTVNGDGTPWASSWRWSVQTNYNLDTSQSNTDRGIDPVAIQTALDAGDPSFNPFAPLPASLIRSNPFDTATSRSSVGKIDLQTNGALFKLPAGDVNVSLRVSGQTQDFSSDSFVQNIATHGDISRDTGSVRGNIDLPITSRRLGVLDAIGDLSLNANFEVEQLSDFGRLTSTGYGVNWSPIIQIRALVSWTRDSNAPGPGDLGNPVIATPNVSVFDYVRGETVDITQISGGNPSLRADTRHVFKAGLNIRPLDATNLTLTANYTNQHYRNTFGSLPGATVEIEAIFPDRFVRDEDGRLLSIDNRPINYARYDHSELRWGFNLFLPIASPAAKRLQERRTAFRAAMEESQRTGQPLPPEMTAQLEQFKRLGQQQSLFGGNQGPGQRQGQGQAGQGQPQGQGEAPRAQGGGRGPGGGGPGGGFGGGRGPGGGRGGFGGNVLQFSAFHTWVFRDERQIAPGLPVLDYLNGAATSSRSGGTPAHKIEVQSGIMRDGFRLRLDGSWESGSEVTTGTLGSAGRLDFGSLAKVNLTAQVDLGQQLNLLLKHPWLRGSRISFRIDNLFNARRRVTDQTGAVPAAYDPSLLDPTGRVVRLSFRKMFF